MKIKREDILHLAELSDFSLTDEEIESLGGDLQSIIKYISQLDELDTDGVEPTYQVDYAAGCDARRATRPNERRKR